MLFSPYHWVAISAASAFGVYGYMSVYAPITIYVLLQALSIIAIGIVVVGLTRGRSQAENKLVSLGLFVCGIVAMTSILHSWVHDFQPQGRYLLPCLPLVALISDAARRNLPLEIMRWLAITAFAVSVCSFAVFGLAAFIKPA